MQIGQRMAGDVTVMEITGDITLSKGGDVIIKDKVQSLLQQGNRKLLLDLGNVWYRGQRGSRTARAGLRDSSCERTRLSR